LKENQLLVAPLSDMDHFLWREGIISFDDATFSELLDKLELYFDVKIEIKNKAVPGYRCTGKFRTKDGIDHILKVLQQRNEFKYTINEKRNLIIIE
jgi:ferric-dicitrate binding protein FerR (iron transport regulator)